MNLLRKVVEHAVRISWMCLVAMLCVLNARPLLAASFASTVNVVVEFNTPAGVTLRDVMNAFLPPCTAVPLGDGTASCLNRTSVFNPTATPPDLVFTILGLSGSTGPAGDAYAYSDATSQNIYITNNTGATANVVLDIFASVSLLVDGKSAQAYDFFVVFGGPNVLIDKYDAIECEYYDCSKSLSPSYHSTFNLMIPAGANENVSMEAGAVGYTFAPEPSTFLLLATALAGFIRCGQRKGSQSA